MSGPARRSAGVSSAPLGAAAAARRAVPWLLALRTVRKGFLALGTAAVVAVCSGLVLTASTASGSVVAGPVAVPASATTSVSRDVDTLSRGNIDREARIPVTVADASASTTPAAAVLYVVTAAYLRSRPSTSGAIVTTLATGAQVVVGGDPVGGWQPVSAGSQSGYVKSTLLSATAPTMKPVSSYPRCASGSAVEAGLVANTILVHRAVCATYPDITVFGGIRGDGSEHASGHALDIMTSGARGRQIAAWLQANHSRLGIVEIIYQQTIWTTERASEGWRAMPDRGSPTANHEDHIHVLVV